MDVCISHLVTQDNMGSNPLGKWHINLVTQKRFQHKASTHSCRPIYKFCLVATCSVKYKHTYTYAQPDIFLMYFDSHKTKLPKRLWYAPSQHYRQTHTGRNHHPQFFVHDRAGKHVTIWCGCRISCKATAYKTSSASANVGRNRSLNYGSVSLCLKTTLNICLPGK